MRRLLLVAAFLLLALAAPAHAAFPGANGKIAFIDHSTPSCVHPISTMNPDGTAVAPVTSPANADDGQPAWSADGQRIAFVRAERISNPAGCDYGPSEIWVVNGDGSGESRLTNDAVGSGAPTWSPNGQRITFYRSGTIWTMNADGSDQIDTGQPGGDPAWSPNGQKIAFWKTTPNPSGNETAIYTMNPDGTGLTLVRDPSPFCVRFENCYYDYYPRWSPDGQRIAFLEDEPYALSTGLAVMNANGTNVKFISGGDTFGGSVAWSPDGKRIAASLYKNSPGPGIFTMNADGTDSILIKPGAFVSFLDWQPLPAAPYAHPQSASQLQVSLVPAFRQCGTGGNPSNASHSPPLATGSCDPPRPGSVLAAVGTASQSSAQMTVVPGDSDPSNGNQANVSLAASMTDIQAVAGGDYLPNASGPDMTAVTRLRFTDRSNGYGGLPATATEYDFRVPIDCASTADPSVGSTCSANTTANALVPSLIQEQRQTVVQAFRVRVDDAGNNGVPGDSDDRIFATQGVFVP